MILDRKYYHKIPSFLIFWYQYQLRKINKEKVLKIFNLFKVELPGRPYFYSPRLKHKPQFTGSTEILKLWQEAKLCETICPTNAIEVLVDDFIIDQQGCIACGLCLEIAPKGLLSTSSDVSRASVL